MSVPSTRAFLSFTHTFLSRLKDDDRPHASLPRLFSFHCTSTRVDPRYVRAHSTYFINAHRGAPDTSYKTALCARAMRRWRLLIAHSLKLEEGEELRRGTATEVQYSRCEGPPHSSYLSHYSFCFLHATLVYTLELASRKYEMRFMIDAATALPRLAVVRNSQFGISFSFPFPF